MGAWAVIAAMGLLIAGTVVRLRTPDPPQNYARVRSTLIRDYSPAHPARPARPARDRGDRSTGTTAGDPLTGSSSGHPWVK